MPIASQLPPIMKSPRINPRKKVVLIGKLLNYLVLDHPF